jgi:hypothetical protein
VHLDDKESDEKKAEQWDECLGPKCLWMKRRPTSGNRDECLRRVLVAVTRWLWSVVLLWCSWYVVATVLCWLLWWCLWRCFVAEESALCTVVSFLLLFCSLVCSLRSFPFLNF